MGRYSSTLLLGQVILIAILYWFCSCSDNIIDCGNGYKYIHEGQFRNEIFKQIQDKEGGYINLQIPGYIKKYKFNNSFIIASQVTMLDDYSSFEDRVEQNNGEIKYWIIESRKDVVHGPLLLKDFRNLKKKLGIPQSLNLN